MYYNLTLFFTVDNAQEIEVDTIETPGPTDVTDTDDQEIEADTLKTPDPADAADADTFEELTRTIDLSFARAIDHDAADTLETPDPAVVVNADSFEELTQTIDFSPASIDHSPIDNPPDHLENLQQPTNPIEADTFDTGTTAVVIDRFPSETAGAPIPGIPQGLSRYESHQATHGRSVWGPFQTQRDWEVAYWAKSCGVTSSAVTKLLAIPEVSPTLVSHFCVTKS